MRDDTVDQMNRMVASQKSTNAFAIGNRRQRRIHNPSTRTRTRTRTRTSIKGVIGIYFCYSMILISIVRLSVSSVASASSASNKIAIASKSRNPFNSDRTIVSGFGSRSVRKTIFANRSSESKPKKTKRKRMEKKNIDLDADDDDNDDSLLPSMVSPKLWVQRPNQKHNTNSNKEDDILWVLVRDETPKGASIVLKLTFDDEQDDWVAKKATRQEESSLTRDQPLDRWIPIEGLYGAYKVPSGVLWILIAGTEPVYEAPPLPSASPTPQPSPWWQIRRVTNLEIVHLGNKGYHLPERSTSTTATATATATSSRSKMMIAQSKATLLTASRLREEVRQISLLRKALKQHDFYYVPSSNGQGQSNGGNLRVVNDMTKNLQRTILEANANSITGREGSKHEWWKAPDGNDNDQTDQNQKYLLPDPRFFWNQHAVEPMVRRYKETNEKQKDGQRTKQIADLLLQHVVPLTSAFVGVQKNITVNSENENAPSSKSELAITSYDEILISRRSRFRAGTRFTVRGADATGNCANFAETEQICLTTTAAPNRIAREKTESKSKSNSNSKSKDGIDESRCLRSIASHVQTRGSIPLRWSSPADVKTYRPRVNIGADPLAQARAVRLHILDQLEHYTPNVNENENLVQTGKAGSSGVADIVFINLIDKHSDQGRLGRAFEEVLQAVVDVHASDPSTSSDLPKEIAKAGTGKELNEGTKSFQPPVASSDTIGSDSVKHVWYDFHAEVKNGRWDRLGLLLDEIQPSLTSHGYFLARAPSENRDGDSGNSNPSGWSVQRIQNAVVRTNCMDCLDRTNVVQSIFGRYMLFQQLSDEAGDSTIEPKNQKWWAGLNKIFREKSMKLPWNLGEVAHRLLWADNADAISRLYAGTPALKGDFTRTGKRTKKGALDDGMNSLQRYYLNNFLDADRQEGYDLLVGHAIFSNIIEEGPIDDVETETTNPSNPALSFLGATRESLLSDVIGGSSYEDREDLRDRLEEIGVSKQPNLDLRWLPGDLQTQVRDQASEAPSNQNEVVTPASTKRKEGAFCTRQAMKAIDERSHIELPWWSKSDEDWLKVGDEDDVETQEKSGTRINESSQHQSQVILTPVQLAMVLYLGLKAPTILGGVTIAILSYVYLPECIKHDYQQQKLLRSYIEDKLNEAKESSI